MSEGEFVPPAPYELDDEGSGRPLFLTDGFDFGRPAERDRLEGFASSQGGAVAFPGDAVAQATGTRAVVPDAHNWVYAGPRNVGGRVVALAVDPNSASTLYAGAASGGVFKTIDAGATWFPLWHDEAALPIGAIDISPSNTDVVWAATGEVDPGGTETIRGNGIYRSADAGETWVTTGPPGTDPHRGYTFDAIAAHPTDPTSAVAVGPAGVFRTIDSGATWVQSAAGTYYSDAKFTLSATGDPILFLVRAVSTAGEATVVRLMNPSAADAAFSAAVSAPANEMPVVPAPAVTPGKSQFPARGKIGVGVGPTAAARDTVYVRFVARHDHSHGVYRCRNARIANAANTTWTKLPDDPLWLGEGQGSYNLTMAVDPANVNNVATGMIDNYVSTNADTNNASNVTWKRVASWINEQPAHHSDHHGAVFVAQGGGASHLWAAHDGGISRSTNWTGGGGWTAISHITPIAAGLVQWDKRDRGLHAAQFYDVGQSPTIPSLYGGGMQDNGVFITSGGPTWRNVLGSDGGFVLFDPDDPYHVLATWASAPGVGGITSIEFAGDRAGRLPLPNEAPQAAAWPRHVRQGFRREDGALFVADSAHDPFDAGRVFTSRRNRLYSQQRAAGGELWRPEAVGTWIELQVARIPFAVGGPARLRILDSPVSNSLRIIPGDVLAPFDEAAQLAIQLAPTSDLTAGLRLDVEVNGTPRALEMQPGDFADRAAATPAEIVQALNAAAARVGEPSLWAGPLFHGRPAAVELHTVRRGSNATIELRGSALDRFKRAAGVYRGIPGSPAVVVLPIFDREKAAYVDLNPTAPAVGDLDLEVKIDGGAFKPVQLGTAQFVDRGAVRSDELVAVLASALAADGVVVRSRTGGIGVSVADPAAGPPVFPSTAGVNMPAIDEFAVPVLEPFDLSAADRRIDITNAAGTTTASAAAADFIDATRVWPDEIATVLTAKVAAIAGFDARIALAFRHDGARTGPTEIEFDPARPGRVWVGGHAGQLFSSDDSGANWRDRSQPVLRHHDRRVEAVAFHPTEDQIVYVGLHESIARGPGGPTCLHRSEDGGSSWQPVGVGLVDTNGVAQGVNALAVDRETPDHLYAATNIGVFRSLDRGATFAPFNQGLPNVRILDMVLEPQTRSLRVSAWGRGMYERHVGNRPAKNVSLFVRANSLDRGVERPAPIGSAPFASVPQAVADQSPDIKVTRSLPVDLLAPNAPIDGVDFDDRVSSDPVAVGPNDILVQVHNRGHAPATGVHIALMWADCSRHVPGLPADFWENLAAAQQGTALPATLGDWNVVGEHVLVDPNPTGYDRVTNEMPRVHRFTHNFSASVDEMQSIGILVSRSGRRLICRTMQA